MKANGRVNIIRRKIMTLLTSGIGRNKGVLNTENIQQIERILIVRPNSRLGNQLMVTPLIQEVEKLFPHAKIDLFVRSKIAPTLFQNYRNIDQIINLPSKPFKQLWSYLKVWINLNAKHYNLVINMTGGSSSGRLATKITGAKYKLFCDIEEEYASSIDDYKHMAKHPVYCLRSYLKQADITSETVPTLSIRLNNTEINQGNVILYSITNNDKPTIGIYTFATGSKCFSKEWWSDVYDKLCTKFKDKYNIIEVLPIENISQIDFKAPSYYSRDIREMAGVMDNLAAFITADCGIMHLASATNTPVLSLFSTTDPNIYKPYNQGNTVLIASEIKNSNEITSALQGILSSAK